LSRPGWRRAARRALDVARVLLGVALCAWVLSRPDTAEAVGAVLTTPWLVPFLALFGAVGASLESLRLVLLFRSQGIALGFVEGLRVIALGVFFNFAVPGSTGGDVMKLYYLARDRGGRRVEVATVLVVDRFIALFSLLSIVLLLVRTDAELVRDEPLVRSIATVAALAWGFLLAGAVLFTSRRVRLPAALARAVLRLPLARYALRGRDALRRFGGHAGAVLAAFLVSALGHAMLLALFVSAARVLLPDAPAARVCLLSLLGLLVNALPITPGGLGVGEAAFDQLFRAAGYARGSPLILAWRAAQLPLFALGGILYTVGGMRPGRGRMQRGRAGMRRGDLGDGRGDATLERGAASTGDVRREPAPPGEPQR
jgi:uncharacterized protein (TIRG00374 family)